MAQKKKPERARSVKRIMIMRKTCYSVLSVKKIPQRCITEKIFSCCHQKSLERKNNRIKKRPTKPLLLSYMGIVP